MVINNELEALEMVVERLPKAARDMIREVSCKRQVPLALVLPDALCAISVAIGSKVEVEAAGYTNRLNIFNMVIAPSGSNKSQPMSDLLAPVEAIDLELHSAYELEVAQAEEEARQASKKRRDPFVKLPPPRCIIVQNMTRAARFVALEYNPHGIVLYLDEASTLFKDMGQRQAAGEADELMTIFDGKTIKCNRKTSPNAIAKKPYMSLLGGLQPARIQELLGKGDYLQSGFLARFDFFIVEEEQKNVYNPNCALDPDVVKHWEDFIHGLYNVPVSYIAHFNPDQPTEKVYEEAYNSFDEQKRASCNDYLKAVLSKMNIKFIKYAGLMACARALSSMPGSTPCGEILIDASDMEASVALCRYLVQGHSKVYDYIMGGRITKPSTREIITFIRLYNPNARQCIVAEALGVGAPCVSKNWVDNDKISATGN